MGLAALTKGPVGPILVILTIFVFLIINRGRGSNIKLWGLFLGILLFLAVTLPWFIAMANIHKEAFLEHIWSVEIVNKAVLSPTAGKTLLEKEDCINMRMEMFFQV